MTKTRVRGLGRGLEALIPSAGGEEGGSPQLVELDQIRPSPQQARRHFDPEELRELSVSIREHGILQPVLLRRVREGFELIAGERRCRAARLAGLKRVPALVRAETGDQDQLLLGLVENLQRKDLDPIEEATGIRRLIDQFGLTHEQAAAKLGKHRVAISQALRLLAGSPALISATAAGAVSAGHARALVGLPSHAAQEHGLKVVLGRRLSVRQTERWVAGYQPPRPRRPAAVDLELGALAVRLAERLGAPVSIVGGASRGRLTIEYGSHEQLQAIRAALGA